MSGIDFDALGAQAAANGANQTVAKEGGGFDLAASGPGFCRFVGYVEIGKQKGTFKGAPTVKDKVQLIFELVGKRHAVEEGKQPHRITVTETYSLDAKANFFKLFQLMNYKQNKQHIVQLLGAGFKCEVFHDKWTDRAGKERTDVVLRGPAGWSIAPPRKEDEDSETGWIDVVVPPAKSSLRGFLWNHCTLEQWAGLFIEGEYPERKDDKGVVTHPAKSKNVLQHKIMGAVNFDGSPIHTLLLAAGTKLDLPAPGEDDDRPEASEGNDQGQPASPAASPSQQAGSTTSPSNDALGGIV